MSLVGSLEDLGLGDILQIVSLSRKSGLLRIHSELGEGRIVFRDGLVRAAYVKGEPEDLRSLLVGSNFIRAEEFDRAVELSNSRAASLDQVIPECTSLTAESLDSARREQVERSVFRIFSWVTGEFSFEVSDQIEARDLEILIPTGINAQYLTMEATRLSDESSCGDRAPGVKFSADAAPISEPDDAPILFSGEVDPAGSRGFAAAPGGVEAAAPVEAVEPEAAPDERDSDASSRAPADVLALAASRREAPELEREAESVAGPEAESVAGPDAESVAWPDAEPVKKFPAKAAGPASLSPSGRANSRSAVAAACLIAIDPNLSTLEWQKLNLAEFFPRVHIFQNAESGIARIRQYLRRGEIPIVLVSIDLARGRVSGVENLAAFIRRLKLLAPSMPVLVARYENAQSEEGIDAADAILSGPDPAYLANRKAWSKLVDEAKRFRTEVAAWLKQPAQPSGQSSRANLRDSASGATGSESLRTLRSVSERIRDPGNQGDALKLVLEFASESFSRVAMFMVRDDVALGIAQRGLPRGGGPDDAGFREIETRAADIEWFRRVLEARSSLCSPVIGEGDRALSKRIGDREPAEAYVAPIVSGGRVVALLYADNLPGGEPIGDTSVIEIALHEAGLALERALLKRALAQLGDPAAS